jgi:hypothetical protein
MAMMREELDMPFIEVEYHALARSARHFQLDDVAAFFEMDVPMPGG